MNREVKELQSKSNEELCALVTRLNSQLLESRFKMAMGEVQKTHIISQIRQTIARCMFILNQRDYDISIGSHGVYLIDKKNNKVRSVTDNVTKILENKNVSNKNSRKDKNVTVNSTKKTSVAKENITKKEPIKKNTVDDKKNTLKEVK